MKQLLSPRSHVRSLLPFVLFACLPAAFSTQRPAPIEPPPLPPPATAPAGVQAAPAKRTSIHPAATRPDPVIDRIRDEGLNHSHVMATLDTLCNVIGPR